VAGFVDVLLRGLALCGQAVTVGGVFFALLLLRPALGDGAAARTRLSRSLALTALGGAVVAAAQLLSLGVQLSVLGGGGGWPIAEVARTSFFRAGAVRILACLGLVGGCVALRRRPEPLGGWIALAGLTVLLGFGSAWTSHAAGRLGPRAALLILDALHQLAAGVWIGGLLHLTLIAASRAEAGWSTTQLKRFSATAFVSVAILVVAGVGLTVSYVDGPGALLGTSYGSMIITKAAVLAGLVVLGAANFFVVRGLPAGSAVALPRLRRFVEVEFGLGATVLFIAASLTSLPPASDVVTDRASFAEVSGRFAPRWPAFTSPKIEDMPVDDRNAPRTDADRAWSEFNHHWAGIFVLAMGLLALVHATGRARWARHWPLVFLGLAGFMLVRNDPGAWPLGPLGFWESMLYPEVLQHRIFVLLVIAFGVFEWLVRTDRVRLKGATLVFPLLCSVGGGLLLTHSHAGLNLKEEYLVEVTHVPLGLLAIITGWGRWLELRLPPPAGRRPAWIWPLALTLVGVSLILYRES